MTIFFQSKINRPTKIGQIYTAKDGEGKVTADELTISSPLHTFVYKFDEAAWFMRNRQTGIDYALGEGASATLTIEITKLHDLDYFETIVYWNDPQSEIEFWELTLKLTDYKTSKHADGEYSEEEWGEIAAERRAWRQKIRELTELEAQEQWT